MDRDSYSDAEIKNFLKLKKVAVIGMSRSKSKAAHFVPKYLSENGFDIIPINPNSDQILTKKCYKEITDVEDSIEEDFPSKKDNKKALNKENHNLNLLKNVKLFYKSNKELDRLCSKEQISHQGLIAEIEHLEKLELKEFVKNKNNLKLSMLCAELLDTLTTRG